MSSFFTKRVRGAVILFSAFAALGCSTEELEAEGEQASTATRVELGADEDALEGTYDLEQARANAAAWLAEMDERDGNLAAAGTDWKKSVCWRKTKVRGVGKPVSACPGADKDGALCYPHCKQGYNGVGPVCWQECPSGYKNDGAFCRKDANIISADNSACPWYDKCGLVGAKGCSKCPAGYKNDGCTCRRDAHIFAKDSYGRGVGSPMKCPADMQYDAGLCYDGCPSGYDGVGPVCWMKQCPASLPYECGAGCAKDKATCTKAIASQVVAPIKTIGNAIVQNWGPAIQAGVESFNNFKLPICK